MPGSRLQEHELERLERNRYAQRLGFVVDECADGGALVRLPGRPETLNRGGRIHGGAIASGVITSAALASASSERDGDARRVLALSVSVSFLQGVGEREISFFARVARRGKYLVHTEVEALAGTERIVSALAAHAIDRGEPGTSVGLTAMPARFDGGADLQPQRMSGSPYGAAAGIEILSEIGSEARLRMPADVNGGEDGCADPGAILGLIDNCGAFATYSHPGVTIEQAGATVSMNVAFGPPVAGPLRAVGRVAGKIGDAFTNEVEVAGVDGSTVAATATMLYRMRAVSGP